MKFWLLIATLAVVPAVIAAPRTAAVSLPFQPSAWPAQRLAQWTAAVFEHQPGTVDPPATRIATWPRGELLGLLHERTFGSLPASALKRGMLLHTDVSLLVANRSLSIGSTLLVQDGERGALVSSELHLEFARLLADRTGADPSRDADVRQWYVAMIEYTEARSKWMEASLLLERARMLFHDDAVIALLDGCLDDAYARPHVQAVVQQAPHLFAKTLGSRDHHLRKAEEEFRRAIEIDPAMAEAHLRHGRVAGLLGHHLEAARELRDAAASAGEPALRYCANLFLGDEEQAAGHRDAAAVAYEAAAAVFPTAQSPRLALSQLARRNGDRAEAVRAIAAVLTLPDSERERDDPWWDYYNSQGRHAEQHLSEWRAAITGAQR